MFVIEIHDLCKSFEDTILFNNLNLTIDDGEFIVFSGVSGCGKTTLLNMIGGIEKVDAGKIIVDGLDITNKKSQLFYFRHKVGFLFQNYALVDNKTVRENLNLIKNNCRNNVTIEEVLEKVSLLDKIDDKVYRLSGGEQQRVALARLMLKKCDIILADEPTGSLDKENADVVIDLLKQMNVQQKIVIMVTHDRHYMNIGSRNIEISNL